MKPPAQRHLHVPNSLSEALEIHARHGAAAEYFAGGTWIMRADLREESDPRQYICLAGLRELRDVSVSTEMVSIGSAATHASIAATLCGIPEHAALTTAASKSANPAIRNMATIGGNICTTGFAAADLVPALMCLSASVEIASDHGRREIPLAEFLRDRHQFKGIVTRVLVPRQHRRSAHARLPLKKAGDYPVAIVSVSAKIRADRTMLDPIIAVGSVEAVARRWSSLESQLHNAALQADEIAAVARRCLGDFNGRDGIDAPGWYRIRVLPEVARRAFLDLLSQTSEG